MFMRPREHQAYLPLSPSVDGVQCAEYITTHSYARARVPESRVGVRRLDERGRREWRSAPCSYYTSLKSCHPLRCAVEIYSRFHTLLGEGGGRGVNSPCGKPGERIVRAPEISFPRGRTEELELGGPDHELRHPLTAKRGCACRMYQHTARTRFGKLIG